MLFKKGAMFGLDARIALAIFGALSVISGAALYSAIEKAKMTQITVRMEEIGKAFQAYIIDTGVLPPAFASPYHTMLDPKEMLNSTVKGWQGPYTSEKIGKFNDECTDCVFSGFDMPYVATNPSFRYALHQDDSSKYAGVAPCSSGETCRVFVSFNYLDTTTANKLDEYIDGTRDPKAGKLRIHNSSTAGLEYVLYDLGININQF